MAGENLRIAQHRDTLRYARVRSGDYQPQLRRFAPGSFVYVQQEGPSLQLPARPVMLRVKEARGTGVLVLQGSDGRTVRQHHSRCAPCHLPNIDTRIEYSRAPVEDDEPCQVCGSAEDPDATLICDACNCAYHLYCLVPALTAVPRGKWICPACVAAGVSARDIEATARSAARRRAPAVVSNPELARDAEARALHGRYVRKRFVDPATRKKRWYYGRLHFRGPTFRPDHLQVTYQDSDMEIDTWPRLQRSGVELLPPSARLPAGVTIPLAADLNPDRTSGRQLGGEPGLPAV